MIHRRFPFSLLPSSPSSHSISVNQSERLAGWRQGCCSNLIFSTSELEFVSCLCRRRGESIICPSSCSAARLLLLLQLRSIVSVSVGRRCCARVRADQKCRISTLSFFYSLKRQGPPFLGCCTAALVINCIEELEEQAPSVCVCALVSRRPESDE